MLLVEHKLACIQYRINQLVSVVHNEFSGVEDHGTFSVVSGGTISVVVGHSDCVKASRNDDLIFRAVSVINGSRFANDSLVIDSLFGSLNVGCPCIDKSFFSAEEGWSLKDESFFSVDGGSPLINESFFSVDGDCSFMDRGDNCSLYVRSSKGWIFFSNGSLKDFNAEVSSESLSTVAPVSLGLLVMLFVETCNPTTYPKKSPKEYSN